MACIFCSTDLSNLFWYCQTSISSLSSSLALRVGNDFPGLSMLLPYTMYHQVPYGY